MLGEESNEKALALRTTSHRGTLETNRRFQPAGRDAVVEPDRVLGHGVAPEGFNRRKRSEHRQHLLKGRRPLRQPKYGPDRSTRALLVISHAQSSACTIPRQGTLCPSKKVVAQDGAVWFWMKPSVPRKPLIVIARENYSPRGRRADCGSRVSASRTRENDRHPSTPAARRRRSKIGRAHV